MSKKVKIRDPQEITSQRYNIRPPMYNYDPYPYNRPGPKRNDDRKTEIQPDIKLRPFNFAAKPVPNLNEINWEKITAVTVSDNSSNGVIYVETEDGACVVKGTTEVAVDYFLYKLCLILGIPVPQLRILKWTDNEFKKLITEIDRATFSEELLNYRVRPRLDNAFLQIMEYIPGISIVGMGEKRANRAFSHITPESRDRLIRLGMIFSFDAFINNYDRYPFLWDNDGNPDNLILRLNVNYTTKTNDLRDPNSLEIEFERFYALDHRITLIDIRNQYAIQNLSKYYTRMENFLNELFMELKKVMEAQIDPILETVGHLDSINTIKKFIQNNTGYQLREMQTLQIMLGIVLGIENINQLGIDRIGMMHNKLFVSEDEDWRNLWNKNLDKINMEIFADIINMFGKLRAVYSDIIKWAREITLNQYHINIIEWEKAMGMYVEPEKQLNLDQDEEENQKKLQEELDQLKIKNEEEKDQIKQKIDENDVDAVDKKIKELFDLDLNQIAQDAKNGKVIENTLDNKSTKLNKK